MDRVLFIGSKQLGLRILTELHASAPESLIGVVTLDDSADSRSELVGFTAFCASNGIDMHSARDRKHSEDLIATLRPDLCVVVGWYWLISGETLLSVPRGFIGLHYSLLPRYRGGSPLVWQIINHEERVGFSLFSFGRGIDDGPIWTQGSIPLEDGDYIGDVLDKLENEASSAFAAHFPLIVNGVIRPAEQQHESATYCAQRTPADGDIDWSCSATEVRDFIRAQSRPYPGAFTWLEGGKLTIWSADLFHTTYYGTPGQVARITPEGVCVICGDDTALVLKEVELAGQIARADEVIRSIKSRLSVAALRTK